MDRKNIYDFLNSMLTKEDIVSILNYFGFDAKLRTNFRLRPDDENPSASIFINNKNGIVMIKDFGDDFTGDIFRTLKKYAGVPYRESADFIKKYLNLNENEIDTDFLKKYSIRQKNTEISEKETLSTEEIEKKWKKLYELHTLPPKKFKECINKLVDFNFFISAPKIYREEFLKKVRYSSFADDVVVRADTPDGKILSYKYRRFKTKNGDIIKWKAVKGTEANKYSQIRIRNPEEPVFIVEGYHDYINALLSGINFISIPYKHYKNFKQEELSLLKNRKYSFVLIQDYDFDEKDKEKLERKKKDSRMQAININKALSPYSKEGRIFVWSNIRKIARYFGIKETEKIKDFSDLINNFPVSSPLLFKKRLLNIANTFIKKQQNPEFRHKNTKQVPAVSFENPSK